MNNDIDKNFRSLESNVLSDPPAHAWDQINETLNGKRRRRHVVLWIVAIIGVIGSVVSIVNIQSSEVLESSTPVGQDKHLYSSDVDSRTTGSLTDESVKEPGTPIESIVGAEVTNPGPRATSVGPNLRGATPEPQAVVVEFVEDSMDNLREGLVLEVDPKVLGVNKRNLDPMNQLGKGDFKIEDPNVQWNEKKTRKLFVEFGGLLGSHRKMYAVESELAQTQRKTEVAWYTWGAYVGVGYNFTSRFYGIFNANFMQQKEQFSYYDESVTRLIADLDPITGETHTYTESGAFKSEGEVRYTTLDGAIHFGYNLMSDKQRGWTLSLEPGLTYNASLKTTGKVMVSANDISRHEDEGFYKTRLGFGLQNQIVVERPFGNLFRLQVKPYHRYYFQPWSSDVNSATIRIQNFGVKLGLQKRF